MSRKKLYPTVFLIDNSEKNRVIFYDYTRDTFFAQYNQSGDAKISLSFLAAPITIYILNLLNDFFVTDFFLRVFIAVLSTLLLLVVTPFLTDRYFLTQKSEIQKFADSLFPIAYTIGEKEKNNIKRLFRTQFLILTILAGLALVSVICFVITQNFVFAFFYIVGDPILYLTAIGICPRKKIEFMKKYGVGF